VVETNQESTTAVQKPAPAKSRVKRRNAEPQPINQNHANRRFKIMSLNSDYLQELSDLFVADVRKSAYYANLSEKQRGQFDAQVEDEGMRGLHPLLPGAAEEELERLSKAIRKELGMILPIAAVEILRQVD